MVVAIISDTLLETISECLHNLFGHCKGNRGDFLANSVPEGLNVFRSVCEHLWFEIAPKEEIAGSEIRRMRWPPDGRTGRSVSPETFPAKLAWISAPYELLLHPAETRHPPHPFLPVGAAKISEGALHSDDGFVVFKERFLSESTVFIAI